MFIISELVALLTTNLILTQALGTSTLFIAAGSRKNLLWTAITISVFLFYVLVIGIIYVILLTILYFADRKNFCTTRKYVHMSAFNCAVMGTLFTISDSSFGADMSMGSYIMAGAEAGTGFIFAAFVLTAAFKRLNSKDVPAAFRGFPATLVYLGIISMAIYALL